MVGITISSVAYSAKNAGTTISRANCWAPFPKTELTPVGKGWYNESFTYDRLGFAKYLSNSTGATSFDLKPFYHEAFVVSEHKNVQTSKKNVLKSSNGYINSWRIYAGNAEPAVLPYPQNPPYFSVQGTHWEKLNSGKTVKFTTTATACFDKFL